MNAAEDLERDPFLFLDRALGDTARPAFRLPGGELCLTDAAASRQVLTNAEGDYQDHSDFFHTRRGNFGPRALQVEMGRAAMKLLYAGREARATALAGEIERALFPRSVWPDAGNWLVYRHLAEVLIGPDRPQRLRQRVDQIVERSVLAGARERRGFLSRTFFRFQVMRELERAVEETQLSAARSGEAAGDAVAGAEDILAVVALAGLPQLAGRKVPASELAEVFLSFLFALAGSVGFTLAWSLYLLASHPGTAAPPALVVREALRLYPVAWLLARQPARSHQLAGEAIGPDDTVVVCPYAVQRNPRHWDDPQSFRPERFAAELEPEAFIPFGAGPHKCVGASFSLHLVSDILKILDAWQISIEKDSDRPQKGAALAPPPFRLQLEKKHF